MKSMSKILFSQSTKNRLLSIYRNEPIIVKAVIAYSLLISAVSLLIPVAVQSLVNSVVSVAMMTPALLIGLFVFCIMSFLLVLTIMRLFASEYLERRVFIGIAKKYFSHLNTGENALNDFSMTKFLEVSSIEKVVASRLVDSITLALQMSLSSLMLIVYHPYFLIYVVILGLFLYYGYKNFGEKGFQYAIDMSDQKFEILKSLQSKSDSSEENEILNKYLKVRQKFFKVLFSQNVFFMSIPVIGTTLLMVLGAYLILKEQLSVGQLVAAELMAATVFMGVSKLGKILEDFYRLNASLKKVESTAGISDIKELKSYCKQFESLNPSKPFIELNSNAAKLVIAALVLILLLPWIQTSPGSGRVIAYSPDEREQQIDAPIDGRVKKWSVVEGSHVKKGDPICELTDNDPDILSRLRTERDATLKRLEAVRLGAQTSQKNIVRQKQLFEQGLSSERSVEMAKLDYVKQVTDEANASAELSRIDVRLARQANQLIIAPIEGTILKRASGVDGAILKTGEMLAVLVPDTDSRVVEIYVSGLDVPLIREGQAVRLQFEGWPAIQFSGWPSISIGTFGGIVKYIDAAATLNGLFRVLVVPAPNEEWPNGNILRQGVRAKAWIRLNRVMLGFEIWRQFNGFPVSLPHENVYLPESKKQEKKN